MNKKERKLPDLLKNAFVFLFLLLITLVLLQFPKLYYCHQDKQLLHEVSTVPYSVKMGSEPMTFEQKLTALVSDNTLLTVEDRTFDESDSYENIRGNLEKQFAALLPSFWSDELAKVLNPSFQDSANTEIQITKFRIFQVIDNKTYSFYLTMLNYDFYTEDFSYIGRILFDSDDYRIIALNAEHMPLTYEAEVDTDTEFESFYKEFTPEDYESQQTQYYSDLADTKFEPTCYHSSCSFSVNAFAPYAINDSISKELDFVFSYSEGPISDSVKTY